MIHTTLITAITTFNTPTTITIVTVTVDTITIITAGKEHIFHYEQKGEKNFHLEKPHHWVQKCHTMPESYANMGHVFIELPPKTQHLSAYSWTVKFYIQSSLDI
ncbi:hypothetical protein MS3_00002835 [Schistosoma haematobium]|uniref:Uncharacterized protein n=1 Tax=Schistosoma haematobium TaxID=6185 RepID=A0A922LMN4_SCHHA|nr:hypothetical protein MS3_00002835 [Schistosoma haematobium]KAH9589967.1 hypothetical protein MS3_00002835 [Schistosoma haematobium]